VATRVVAQGGGGGISVAGAGHDRGDSTARVYIIEFGDFGCSYCAKFAAETYPAIDSAFIRTGTVRWKYIPYVTGMFRNAREVAEGAECAAEQGAFWKMHDLLFQRRKEWMAAKAPRTLVARYASELKLDGAAFARCTMGTAARTRVARHDAIAGAVGVHVTPTFFVNGRLVRGAIPFALFKRVIEEADR
jgi:protein-disulfide isomerase